MPVLVKHSGLRMVAVNRESIALLDDTWDVLGVYFLFGPGKDADSYTAYVGEAGKRSLRLRLREHVRNKESWTRALLITSADSEQGFDSAAIGWLEGRLHAVLSNATQAEVLNANTPRDESLPAYERESLEGYVKPVMTAMQALGYPPDTPDQRQAAPQPKRRRRYSESLSDLLEVGLLRVGMTLTALPANFDAFVEVGADGTVQSAERRFDTLSGAAQDVTGRPTNGWDFWGVPSGDGELKPMSALRARLRVDGADGATPTEAADLGADLRSAVPVRASGKATPSAASADDAVEVTQATGDPTDPTPSQVTPRREEYGHGGSNGADLESERQSGQAEHDCTPLNYRPEDVEVRADVTVGHLYSANLVEGDGLVAIYKGQMRRATSMGSGAIRLDDGREFPTLSAAGQALTGRPTNGWTFWKDDRPGKPVALSALRDQLLALEPQMLRSSELQGRHVPPSDAPWPDILHFSLRFNGYGYLGGGPETLEPYLRPAVDRWRSGNGLPHGPDELRAALFAHARNYTWTDMTGGDPADMDFIRALVEAVRALARQPRGPVAEPTAPGTERGAGTASSQPVTAKDIDAGQDLASTLLSSCSPPTRSRPLTR